MIIISRYIAKSVYIYFLFVFIGFIGLFVILDFISEAKDVTAQYNYGWAIGQVLLRTIYYLYQFIPIAALIACVLAVVKLSQQSEFIIMRMHGLSLFKILKIFTFIALPLIIFTFSLGEYLVPLSAKLSQEIKQRLLQKTHLDLKSGFWLKYQAKNSDSHYILRITQLNPTNNLRDFSQSQQLELKQLQANLPNSRIFAYIYVYEFIKNNHEFKQSQQLKNIYFSKYASIDKNQALQTLELHWGKKINILKDQNQVDASLNKIQSFTRMKLDFQLPPGFIEYLGMKNKAQNMTLIQLREYIKFLKSNQQNSHEYELSLWQKYIYPFTNVLMLWLGAIFIYFKQRQPKQVYTFAVMMAGLLMYLGQTILLQIAQLNTWQPPLIALGPLSVGLLLIILLHLYLQKK